MKRCPRFHFISFLLFLLPSPSLSLVPLLLFFPSPMYKVVFLNLMIPLLYVDYLLHSAVVAKLAILTTGIATIRKNEISVTNAF